MRANGFWNLENAACASPSFARMAGSYRVQAAPLYPPFSGSPRTGRSRRSDTGMYPQGNVPEKGGYKVAAGLRTPQPQSRSKRRQRTNSGIWKTPHARRLPSPAWRAPTGVNGESSTSRRLRLRRLRRRKIHRRRCPRTSLVVWRPRQWPMKMYC